MAPWRRFLSILFRMLPEHIAGQVVDSFDQVGKIDMAAI